MESAPTASPDHAADLLALYEAALPEVYGYVARRCGGVKVVAEDVTSEVFMAAVAAARKGSVEQVTIAWLIGIARHKMVDHWRRHEREQRRLSSIAGELGDPIDDWDLVVDQNLANEILLRLAPQHRMALSLRYLDGLSVPECAAILDRTVHATEALLMRSKAAFRRAYNFEGSSDV